MNIYVNMFLYTKVQTQGTCLQRRSLYNGSDSGRRHGNPITQRLFSIAGFMIQIHGTVSIRGVEAGRGKSLSIDIQDRKEKNFFSFILCPKI